MLRDLAPAKINLFLHILGRREDGYHLLESLVGFADFGDELALEPGPGPSLSLEGPMAAALGDASAATVALRGAGVAGSDDNLVLRAARLFQEVFAGSVSGHFTLSKHLPVASGIGGGSSDAASALRLLCRANQIPTTTPQVAAIARQLGADVPVCLEAKPRLMRGIGHELGPVLTFVEYPAVLIHPGVAVKTPSVFAALKLKPGERYVPPGLVDVPVSGNDALVRLQSATRNHLEPAAIGIAPKIRRVIQAIEAEPGCRFARMSGSGATCFGLFETDAAALNAAQSIKAIHYRWWVRPCRIQIPL